LLFQRLVTKTKHAHEALSPSKISPEHPSSKSVVQYTVYVLYGIINYTR